MASNDISDLLIDKDLGPVSAYAMAVAAGYTGTEEQFAEDLANAGQNVQAVTEAAQQATAAASRAADAAATASAAYNTDLLAVTFDQTEGYVKGKHVIYSGKYYVLPNGHDANVTWENTTKTEEKVGNEISDLKSAFDELPKTVETEESDADLYIADANGYVVVKFSNGGIKTKNFDSSDPQPLEITNSNANLDISDGQGYVIARFSDGHIRTKKFDSSAVAVSCEYMFFDDKLYLSYGYTDDSDAVVCMDVGRANDLFDFNSFYTKPRGKKLIDCGATDLIREWGTGTDMHSPFQFLAVNNPDGARADSDDPSYTGGNHTMTINGQTVQTASSKYVYYFADGIPVDSGNGVFRNFEIRWANNVQAFNCVKADGTGRTSLIEYHDMIFDGIEFKERIELVPTEDIRMRLWSGFQLVGWGSVCDHVRFMDATNRGTYTTSDSDIKSGNATASGVVEWGNSHTLEMTVDTNIDLGKRQYYSGSKGAHMGETKAYFFIIYGQFVNMDKDTHYDLCGTFRFYPTIR